MSRSARRFGARWFRVSWFRVRWFRIRWFSGRPTASLLLVAAALSSASLTAPPRPAGAQDGSAQDGPAQDGPAPRGSIVEDRAAKQLIAAGDGRYESEETAKAVEIWKSVLERYPRSRFRFTSHMRLGVHYLDRERASERARGHFEAAASESNPNDEMRAEATLKLGVCFHQDRTFGKSFRVLRDVIEQFPASSHVNEAYYYIGLGHFELGHYSRAIESLEKVGTALSKEAQNGKKLEAGRRFFIKVDDADLAVLDAGQTIEVEVRATSGDVERLSCFPVGRNVRVVLGSIPTKLGRPAANNGVLEVTGADQVDVTYIDDQTADKQLRVPVKRGVRVIGEGNIAVTDGAYSDVLQGAVIGKPLNIRVSDADRDVSDGSDKIEALAEVWRRKTDEELQSELAARAAQGAAVDEEAADSIERFKPVDKVTVTLAETAARASLVDDPDAESEDSSIHSGEFRGSVMLVRAELPQAGDQVLQAQAGDQVRLRYVDQVHRGEGVRNVLASARCIDGNIGAVRVTRADISDHQLRLQTMLRTAAALTNIGNRYKEFGLRDKAQLKYQAALQTCEEMMGEVRQLGGSLLEETYVQLWRIYFAMDRLELAAAMCQRLQNEFPESSFVDDALLQLAEVARKSGELRRSIGIFTRLANMKGSQLRGEAQFGIAECYQQMADEATDAAAGPLKDRAFVEYKKVFDEHPDSGRVGEAVAKMAAYYYDQKDYARAIDTFESVLSNHPDAKFLDVILFNYGRCLYRMQRQSEAQRRFDQLLSEFPESPLATDAKQISDALKKAGKQP